MNVTSLVAPVISGAGPLLTSHDLIICDVWGVLHDGRSAYTAAGDALARARARGTTVVLLSNAPTPGSTVQQLLLSKGVRQDCWDALVTSGDITAAHVRACGYLRVHHIGPDRDLSLFGEVGAERVPLAAAEALLVTGLVDDVHETAETYRPLLERAHSQRLPLVCANPDLVVDVGGRLFLCAGSIAALYEEMGGRVYWAGKPHSVAYEAALAAARRIRGQTPGHGRILAIGDAVRTDLEGARQFGIASLFVGAGIHRHEVMVGGKIDPQRLERLLAPPAPAPLAAIAELAW